MQVKSTLSNLEPDRPNINGRIYPRSLMEKIVAKINGSQVLVTSDSDFPPGTVDLTKVVAVTAGEAELVGDMIHFSMNVIPGKEAYFDRPLEFVTNGYGHIVGGMVDEDQYELLNISITKM